MLHDDFEKENIPQKTYNTLVFKNNVMTDFTVLFKNQKIYIDSEGKKVFVLAILILLWQF